MNIQNIKKYALSLALAIGFLAAPGLSSLSTVNAQDWRRDRDNDRWDDRRQDRWDDRWDRRDERRGCRDGFDRGRIDARRRIRPDFYEYREYRYGNRDYREGFRRGYFQAFRQFRFDRW